MTISVKANPDGSGTLQHNGADILKLATSAIEALAPLKSQGSPVVTLADHVSNPVINGYYKLPNGIILQWGYVSYLASDGQNGKTVQFNIPFPSTCFIVVSNDSGGNGTNATAAVIVDRTQFKAYGKYVSTGAWADTGIGWIAVGC